MDDPRFQATFGYSTVLALATIVVGVLLVVPTAYWVQLRLPRLRPVVEFITLLPLVIPAIVIVFGYLRIYGSSSLLPMTTNERATDVLLMFSYVMLSLPYMYRAVDTGIRAIDVATLTEAAESLGARCPRDRSRARRASRAAPPPWCGAADRTRAAWSRRCPAVR